MDWCKEHIHERAAMPKHLEILPELPKTAVGKVFKPELRRAPSRGSMTPRWPRPGSRRVCATCGGQEARPRGASGSDRPVDEAAVSKTLGEFTRPWVLEDR
jgi:hypothetical protein